MFVYESGILGIRKFFLVFSWRARALDSVAYPRDSYQDQVLSCQTHRMAQKHSKSLLFAQFLQKYEFRNLIFFF